MCFVHVMGREGTLTVSTADGSEQSKNNAEEVSQAVSSDRFLLWQYMMLISCQQLCIHSFFMSSYILVNLSFM